MDPLNATTNGTNGQSAAPETTAPATQTPAPAQSQPAASVPQAAPAQTAPGSGLPAQPAAAPAAAATPGIREMLRNFGVDINVPDDQAAMRELANMYRQQGDLRQLAGYGQQYLQHADQFQAYQRQQEDARRAEEAKRQQSWFQAPPYDPSWASKLTRDPNTGQIGVIPGNDPSLAQKYLAWTEHQRGFMDKLAQDPIGTIRPGIEQVAREVASQMIQQQLGGYQEQNAAEQFVRQHSEWLHERDASGGLVIDQRTGRPALSQMGQRFGSYVQEAANLGLRDVAAQQKYAMSGVQRDYAIARLSQGMQQQTPPADPAQAARDGFLRQAAGERAAPAAPPGAGVNGQQPPPQPGNRGLMDQMLADMRAAGFQPGQQLT